MSLKNVDVRTAHQLQIEGDHAYVDVRSVPEYEKGHPAGARNVPLLHLDAQTGQMQPNAEFLDVIRANFAPGTKLLVGCQMGGRSAQAGQILLGAGVRGCDERSRWIRRSARPDDRPDRQRGLGRCRSTGRAGNPGGERLRRAAPEGHLTSSRRGVPLLHVSHSHSIWQGLRSEIARSKLRVRRPISSGKSSRVRGRDVIDAMRCVE